MLILIAESKTMTPCDGHVDPEVLAGHCPVSDAEAGAIMESLRGMPVQQLAERTGLSVRMAGRLQQMVYEFPNKALGSRAIQAYTGVVFKALGYDTLTTAEQHTLGDRVRIISSLYGWLRPDDIIKAYRLDFTTRVAPDGGSLAAYQKAKVTGHLTDELCRTGCREILDLLPGDAAKCIDWREVQRHATVYKAGFRQIVDGTNTRTPDAGRLKTLRGQLLRQIIQDGIDTVADLIGLESDTYINHTAPDRGIITFDTV